MKVMVTNYVRKFKELGHKIYQLGGIKMLKKKKKKVILQRMIKKWGRIRGAVLTHREQRGPLLFLALEIICTALGTLAFVLSPNTLSNKGDTTINIYLYIYIYF